jgi:hypothetical protein
MFAQNAQKQNSTQGIFSFPKENVVEISSSDILINFIKQAAEDFKNNKYNKLYFLAYLISDKCILQYKEKESSTKTINIGSESINNTLKYRIEIKVRDLDDSEFSKALTSLKNKINKGVFNYNYNGQILSPYEYFQKVYNKKDNNETDITLPKPRIEAESQSESQSWKETIPKKIITQNQINIQGMSTEDFSFYVQSLFFNVTNNQLQEKDIDETEKDEIASQLQDYFEPTTNQNVHHPPDEEKNMLEKAFLFFYFYFKRYGTVENLVNEYFTLSNTTEKTNFQKILDFFKSESLDKDSDKVRSVSNIFSNSYLSSYFNSLIDNIIKIKEKK